MTGDPTTKLSSDQFIGYPLQDDAQFSSTIPFDYDFNSVLEPYADNFIPFFPNNYNGQPGADTEEFAHTVRPVLRQEELWSFAVETGNADIGFERLENSTEFMQNEHLGFDSSSAAPSHYPPVPEIGQCDSVSYPYFSEGAYVDSQSDQLLKVYESSFMVQNQPRLGSHGGDNMRTHGLGSAYLAPQVDPHPQPVAQHTWGFENGQMPQDQVPVPDQSFCGRSLSGSNQRFQTESYHPEQQEQSDVTLDIIQSRLLPTEHSQTSLPTPEPSYMPLNAARNSYPPSPLESRDAGHQPRPHNFASSISLPVETTSPLSNLGSELSPQLRSSRATVIQAPTNSEFSGEQVAKPDDADTRNTRKVATKRSSTKKRNNGNKSVNGKGKRKKPLDVNPSDRYKDQGPKPQSFKGITYMDNGQIEQPYLSSGTIREYIDEKKPTIWVQNHPAKCGERLKGFASKCKWEKCPAIKCSRPGIILAGWHRVAFDENENLTTEGSMDPFNVAMVMHLWCFEQCFDLMEFYQNKSLKPETRIFPKEAENPMTLERTGTAYIIQEAYDPWFEKHAPVDQDVGQGRVLMMKPRTHENSLCCALIEYHLKKEYNTREATRAERNKDVREDLQNTINKHRGNLQRYVEVKRKKGSSKKETKGGQKRKKRRSTTSGVSQDMYQNEPHEHSGDNGAAELAHSEPTIRAEEYQVQNANEMQRDQEGVVPGEYLQSMAQGDASTANEVPRTAVVGRALATKRPSSTKRRRGSSAEENQPRKIRRGENESPTKVGSQTRALKPMAPCGRN